MTRIRYFLLCLLFLSNNALSEKNSVESLNLKGPATLTYDFAVDGGKNAGTTGTITFQMTPGTSSVLVQVSGNISAMVDGAKTDQKLQGTYTVKPVGNSRALADIFGALNFGTLSDPNGNEFTLLARLLTVQRLRSESVIVSNLLMVKENLKSGSSYPMPGTSARTSVRSSAMLGKHVWVFTNSFGQVSEKITIRKDNGAVYDLETKTRDRGKLVKTTLKIRSATF